MQYKHRVVSVIFISSLVKAESKSKSPGTTKAVFEGLRTFAKNISSQFLH